MNRKQYLSANIAAFGMALLVWQAQVKAETEGKGRTVNEASPKSDDAGEIAKGVTKGQQRWRRRQRIRSAMRQRALLYEPAIAAAARKYKVDPQALWTIAYLETRFRANQRSPKGAEGLMQFMPGTSARFDLRNPYDALQSIDAAAQYVALLSNQFNGRLDLVLAAYNSGEATVDCYLNGRTIRTRNGKLINRRGVKTGGVPPYKETQAYVRRGMLVYSRVASAAVFSQQLLAGVRALTLPNMAATANEVSSVNYDLADLAGSPAVLYSQKTNAPIATPALSQSEVEDGFATVFFDVNSGARYLVQSGQIVKPLEEVGGEKANDSRKEVTKSVYIGIGTRED